MAAPATTKGFQWRPCVAEWNTFDAMELPARRLSQVTREAKSGNRSEVTISRPPSDPSSEKQARRLASLRHKSERAPSVQVGSWFSSWRGCTRTSSFWWGGGGATQFSAIFTRRQRVSPKSSQPRCSNMLHTRYFRRLALATSAKQHSRALKAPSTRGFCRPATGSVWYWRHKYCLFSPLIV